MTGPRPDAFAALLGIEVARRWRRPHGGDASRPTTATPTRTARCTAPSSTRSAGAAVAAAANDETHSGIISSVLVEYLQPAAIGDELFAEVTREASTEREDIFTGTVRRGDAGDLLAWVRARGTRRSRTAEQPATPVRTSIDAPSESSGTLSVCDRRCFWLMAESVGTTSLTP